MLESIDKNRENQVGLQNVEEKKKERKLWMVRFNGTRGNRTKKFQHFLLCKYRRAYGKLRKDY